MLTDQFQRQFQYLRLSITDRCNFKCLYCLPHGYHSTTPITPSLNLDEINNLISALVSLGISKIRLTGGEPSLRRDLLSIIQIISQFPQIKTIAMTTNGHHLRENIDSYIQAGLTNLNISLDSLAQDTFKQIRQVDKLAYTLETIEYILTLPLYALKINTVLLKQNFNELNTFTQYIKNRPISLRFIELMQTGENKPFFANNYIAANKLIQQLQQQAWQEIPREINAGPAIEFVHPDYQGRIGIIAPYTKDFCASCNRLRITHQGELRLCLFDQQNYNLRPLLQSQQQQAQLIDAMLQHLSAKPKEHQLALANPGNLGNLSNTGG